MPVTLTFDNGPARGTTDQVLDVLGERGLPASFFVVGDMLRRDGGPELAARAAAEGHWIGNHTLTHTTPLGDDPDPVYARREIEETQALLGDLAHERRFFRPARRGRPHRAAPAQPGRRRRAPPRPLHVRAVELGSSRLGGPRGMGRHRPRRHRAPRARRRRAPRPADRRHGGVARGSSTCWRLETCDVVQDFPSDVVPIVDGEAGDLHGLVRR